MSCSVALAHESQMDILATKLGMDPLEFRLRNAFQVGSRTHTGQVLHESVGIKATLEALRAPYAEARARKTSEPASPPWKRGVGLASGWKGVGGGGTRQAAVELLHDGRVRLLAGAVEKGQSTRTTLAQIAAEELGVPLESLVVTIGDTFLAPYPHTTTGQGTTLLVGKALQNGCKALRQALVKAAAQMLEENPENILVSNGYVFSRHSLRDRISLKELATLFRQREIPTKYEGSFAFQHITPIDPGTGQGTVCDIYAYNSALAEVEVNVETGKVKVLRMAYAADAGTIINPLSYDGQCEGGVVFGLGQALRERYVPGQTRTIKAYNPPTIREMPEKITVLSVGEPVSIGPFGAKGGGEMPDVPTVAAIINAIADATDARVFDIPATPDKVLEALGRREEKFA